ncbi:MAG: glycosyltransferase [Conexivisphaerales archaeon]
MSDLTIIIPVKGEKKSNLERIKRTYSGKIKFVFVGRCRVKPYIYDSGTKKESLKRGLSTVRTPLVGFLDSDSIVSIEDVKRAISYFSDQVGGVSGRVFHFKSSKPSFFYSSFYYRLSEAINYGSSLMNKAPILNGNFAIYRTELAKEAFEHMPKGRLGDDRQLPNYIISKGYHAILAKDVSIYTDVPANWKRFLNQIVRWNKSSIYNSFSLIRTGNVLDRGVLFSLICTLSLSMLFLTPVAVSFSLAKWLLIAIHLIFKYGVSADLLTLFMHIYAFGSSHTFLIRAIGYLSTASWSAFIAFMLIRHKLYNKVHFAMISLLAQAIAPYAALISFANDNWERANR